jgi:hypothetical protein
LDGNNKVKTNKSTKAKQKILIIGDVTRDTGTLTKCDVVRGDTKDVSKTNSKRP